MSYEGALFALTLHTTLTPELLTIGLLSNAYKGTFSWNKQQQQLDVTSSWMPAPISHEMMGVSCTGLHGNRTLQLTH